MAFVYSYPAPRVMSARAAADRFEKQFICENFQTEFVQLWAVAYESEDDDSDDVLTVACADVNEHHGLGEIIEIPRSEFEALVPLSALFNTPGDLEEIDTLPIWFEEPRTMVADVSDEAPGFIAEGQRLSQLWKAGEEPIVDTADYLNQGLLLVPRALAADYIDACRTIQQSWFSDVDVELISRMCEAVARHLEPDAFVESDDHS